MPVTFVHLGQAGDLLGELVGVREAVVDLAHIALLVDENGGGQGEDAVFYGRFGSTSVSIFWITNPSGRSANSCSR